MDAAVMSYLCRQRGSPPASCAGLQSWQFHANPGDAKDRGAVVADQLAREADQDRREGRQPRTLRDLSAGRGCGVAADVRRNSVAARPPTCGARAGMTSPRPSAEAMRGEVCLDTSKAARFSAGKPSTAGFDRLLLSATANCRCPNR